MQTIKVRRRRRTTTRVDICYYCKEGGTPVAVFVWCCCNLFNIPQVYETGNVLWNLQIRNIYSIHSKKHLKKLTLSLWMRLPSDMCVFASVPVMSLASSTTQPCHFPLKCHFLLRWQIGGTDFSLYQFLLPFGHDLMQEMFLSVSGRDRMCERGLIFSVTEQKEPNPFLKRAEVVWWASSL